MATHKKRISRRKLVATVAIAVGAALTPMAVNAATVANDATGGGKQSAVRALERAAHPLRSTEPGGNTADLQALTSMIGNAKVVGLGEATHGSHEFFTMKERIFRHLVEKKGFTTFSLEMSWSSGLQIDEYLQTGKETSGKSPRRN